MDCEQASFRKMSSSIVVSISFCLVLAPVIYRFNTLGKKDDRCLFAGSSVFSILVVIGYDKKYTLFKVLNKDFVPLQTFLNALFLHCTVSVFTLT